jgi:Tol biopolymer transport system component
MSALGALVAVACSTDFTADAAASDASPSPQQDAGDAFTTLVSDGGQSNDATAFASDADAAPQPACDLMQPFGAPVAISELNTSADESQPRLAHDERTIYFMSTRNDAGGSHLFTATRATVTDTFGFASPLTTLSGPGFEADPTVTGDNLTLYFATNRTDANGLSELWVATRTTAAAAFSNLAPVAGLTFGENQWSPYVMPDGLTLYWMRGTSNEDLYAATRTPASSFAIESPGPFTQIDTAATQDAPAMSLDGLTLYFTSDRDGGMGHWDIWVATRASTSDPFSNATNLTGLNTSGYDYPGFISDDGCRLYFSSTKAGTSDLYVAAKPPTK